MSRTADSTLQAALAASGIAPVFLADLAFTSGLQHAWTGVGELAWNGNTYLGVGSLGSIGGVTEGVSVHAAGTSVTLSGIDSTLLADCLGDIQIGAPATLWLGAWQNGALVGTPYKWFGGTVDKAPIVTSPKTIAITLSLESRMSLLQRGTNRRYTATDQRRYYPDDMGFDWVEIYNDTADRWGH
jgi:hypothetical protein